MTAAERAILAFFRRYQIGPGQMLFFQGHETKSSKGPFHTAMRSLMNRGMVVKEYPRQAYSLTRDGYNLSLSVEHESRV